MRVRFSFISLAIAMAALFMLASAPVAVPVSVVGLEVAGTVDHAGTAATSSAHSASAHQSCTSPDCTPDPDCPTNMTMSDCDMNGFSCSLCGSTISAHRTGELGIHLGVAVNTIQDPPNFILTTRTTSIFHPPRLVS